MLRRLFRDCLEGLRAGFDVLWWGRAYPRFLPLCRGGSMPPSPPLRPGEERALLSPGWVSPEVADRFPPESIERINQPRR